MCIRVVILCYQHHQGATTSTYIVRVLCLVQVMWAGDIHLFHYYSFLHTQCNMLIYLLSHCIEILEHTTPSSSYAMPTERKLGNFFSYADSGKDFRKVVCPTLNEIAVDVWYVSSTSVVLHAGLNGQLWRMQTNEMIRNEENRRQTVALFPKWNTSF